MAEKWVGHVRIYTPEDTLKEKPGGDFGEAKWERNNGTARCETRTGIDWVIWYRAHSLVPAINALVLLSPNLLPMMASQGGRSGVLRRHI